MVGLIALDTGRVEQFTQHIALVLSNEHQDGVVWHDQILGLVIREFNGLLAQEICVIPWARL